ncbi:MAG TPA: VTT domain-containing protein [Vicinamibacterales bacterium]|nr:VTT domain-containing protein [Vicinamibacterales bacterium]
MTSLLASLSGTAWLGASLSCFGLTVLSAIVPWVNAEVIVLAFVALAHSPAQAALVVIVATAGQMAGKCVVFWAGRRGERRYARASELAARWRDRLTARPWSAVLLVLVSSAIGVPPFFLVTLAAGAVGVNFRRFVIAGTIGRLMRFGSLALLPHAIARIGG